MMGILRWVVALVLLLLSPNVIAGGALRCVVDGKVLYTNLVNRCPVPQVDVQPEVILKAKVVAKKIPKKSTKKMKPRSVVQAKPAQPDWWQLLAGPELPPGYVHVAKKTRDWQTVKVWFSTDAEWDLAKRIIDHQGEVFPDMLHTPGANQLIYAIGFPRSSIRFRTFDRRLLAAVNRDGVLVPQPVVMVELVPLQGKKSLILAAGMAKGRLYLSVPYQK
ncbi:MAG: hypothetical protein R8J84_01455 [Mariprofundales bacterium]